jgi:RNA polymerase-binding transcription factor DksA
MFSDIERDLHDRAAALRRRASGVSHHLRGEDGRQEADFGDRAAFTQADEVLEQLDEEGRAELAAIEAALQRLAEGTYGTCSTCGAEIPEGRLHAVPWTTTCVLCAA